MVEMDDVRRWVVKNKLKTVVYTWLAGVTGSLAVQWTRPIPTSLKLIHTRVYAQALTLAAIAAAGTIHMVEDEKDKEERVFHPAHR